jgi:hypothetical protein
MASYIRVIPIAVTFLACSASATVITFDPEAAGRGGSLSGIPDSPLTIGIATFTGGELREGEIGLPADQTGVYATQGFVGSEENPLRITFSAAVSGFSVLVLNGEDTRSYTVSDNLGDSFTASIPLAGALGKALFTLPGSGITSVSISSANNDDWSFAIDNVSFIATPEPSSILFVSPGLLMLGLAIFVQRYRSKAVAKSCSSLSLRSETAQ